MLIGIPSERAQGEKRAAVTPDVASRLVAAGHELRVQADVGAAAGFRDDEYRAAGAQVVPAEGAWECDLVLAVQHPHAAALQEGDVPMPRSGAALVCFLQPFANAAGIAALAEAGVTSFAMELVPRISRAQSMDALTAMSSVAGYRSVLIAAHALGRFFPLMMTAAGTVPPARVLVLGAGVAGLQAIATARRLGAVVSAFDTRPVVREQVESLGGTFLQIDVESGESGGYATELSEEAHRREQELVAEHVAKSDVVITTALIPGRPAPLLVSKAAVESMRPGSVIVDLAGETGGNCEVSEFGRDVVHAGVTISAPSNVPSTMANHASYLYARTMFAFVQHLAPEGEMNLDLDDEITQATCVTHGGDVVNDAVRERLQGRPRA